MRYAAVIGLAFLVLAAPAFAQSSKTSPQTGRPQTNAATQTKSHGAHKARTKGEMSNSHHNRPTNSGKQFQPGGNGGSEAGGSPSGPG